MSSVPLLSSDGQRQNKRYSDEGGGRSVPSASSEFNDIEIMRQKIKFFFMDPLQKWQTRRK